MMARIEVPVRGFDDAEFSARTAKAQARMADNGLAGMLLMSEPEVRYFTGFHTLFWQSPTRPWFLFVPVEGKPIAVIPEIGAELMRRSWLDDIRTWSAPAPDDDGISLLTELLSPLAASGAKLGVMKGHETLLRMPMGDWERLMAALPGLEIADATRLVQGLRMVKTPAEIEKLGHICAIGSAAFAMVPDFIGEGQPLEEVFREFRRTAIRLGADEAPSAVGAAGHANDPAKRAYDVLWRATQAGIDAAQPGNTCRDLFQAMSAVIAEMDDSGGDIGRLGHGLGMQLTEQPSHAAFDETELTENMVLTIEPSLSYGDGRMMVHEENIVVGSDGSALLTTRAAPELPVV